MEKQIKQMVDFIKQEAEEKANEIRVSAEEVPRRACMDIMIASGVSPPLKSRARRRRSSISRSCSC